jgi:hypothetical protein
MRPKRSSHQEDHIQQPTSKRARIQGPQPKDDLDLGGWLQHAEARFPRVGNQEETKSLRDEDTHVGTEVEMEALIVVQHQHAGAEDTHVLEQIMELPEQNMYMTKDPPAVEVQHQHAGTEDPHVVEPNLEMPGMDTTVAEDTPVNEVLQNSSAARCDLEISGLNTTVVEDTPVCEVQVVGPPCG